MTDLNSWLLTEGSGITLISIRLFDVGRDDVMIFWGLLDEYWRVVCDGLY